MLTAGEIASLVAADQVAWTGELRGDALLLRLGEPLQPLISIATADVVDLADQASVDRLYSEPVRQWENFLLAAGQMVLCPADASLRLGTGHAGALATLSHLARVGLAIHVTSPLVLPGWDGYVTLELVNLGPAPLRIYRGMPVGRMVLFPLHGRIGEAAPHPSYGEQDRLGSRYAEEFPTHTYRR